MNGLDLFSGIGGISLALQPWVRTVAYCEIDRYAQAVLLSRMSTGELEIAPIWPDIRTISGEMLPPIDIIFGGFPCQDISIAGTGAGLDGERSGLFFEITRLCCELRPRFIFLENVPVITLRGLDRVCLEFTSLGYDSRWTIVSAAEIGAPHFRERWFLLAHAGGQSMRLSEPRGRKKKIHASTAMEDGKNSDADGPRLESPRSNLRYEPRKPFSVELLEGNSWDEYAAFFHRVDHGLLHRSHRLRGLGNAVVPIQAREAFMRLMGLQ